MGLTSLIKKAKGFDEEVLENHPFGISKLCFKHLILQLLFFVLFFQLCLLTHNCIMLSSLSYGWKARA